jgi:hypothetical protein
MIGARGLNPGRPSRRMGSSEGRFRDTYMTPAELSAGVSRCHLVYDLFLVERRKSFHHKTKAPPRDNDEQQVTSGLRVS